VGVYFQTMQMAMGMIFYFGTTLVPVGPLCLQFAAQVFSEAGILNKCSCLACALGVTKNIVFIVH
jgi:hypothetical protein